MYRLRREIELESNCMRFCFITKGLFSNVVAIGKRHYGSICKLTTGSMQWEEQIGSNSDMSGDDFDFPYGAAMNKERNRVIFGCPNCDAAMDLIHLESEMWIHNR